MNKALRHTFSGRQSVQYQQYHRKRRWSKGMLNELFNAAFQYMDSSMVYITTMKKLPLRRETRIPSSFRQQQEEAG
ncbi:MAG: hypothetical protein K5657_02870 [Desulfovibrio sp.]|nr:hypothetical protein [Desulfovibrio sp.]